MRKLKKLFFTLCIAGLLAAPVSAHNVQAHQGRTDSSGGHKDNQNKSGLGSYHYHCGGYPAHLHTNGNCPYRTAAEAQPAASEPAVSPSPPVPQSGWQLDSHGWWYLNTDGSYPQSSWKAINGNWYYFGEEGYLYTNTYTPDGYWVNADGVWTK